jgi:hypothetical protein
MRCIFTENIADATCKPTPNNHIDDTRIADLSLLKLATTEIPIVSVTTYHTEKTLKLLRKVNKGTLCDLSARK